MEFSHKSVLLWECIDALNIRPNGIYLDGTLGGGGHSLEICRRLTNGRLIGVDRDEVALEAAKKRLSRHARKVTLVHDNFENIALILDALNLDKIDGMLWTAWTGCSLTWAFRLRSWTTARAAFRI